jgi:hypothetical protein
MTDVLLLTTSAAWRKLNQCSVLTSEPKETELRHGAKSHAVNYLSLAPYSTEDGSHHLEGVANEDAIAACNLALYRACILYGYKHIVNKDFQKAHEECHQAIIYLQKGLARLGIPTKLKQHDIPTRARCFVNSLASQAELQQARIKHKIASQLVFVLGMHRSGTSAITGMLAQAGFTAPTDQMEANIVNPKGFWESVSINKLNEGLLQQMESHWSSSLPLPAGWSESITTREWRSSLIRIISETFGGAELPTIKDPRFCLLIFGLEPWLESRLIETSFIIPVRNPIEVCNSLLQAQGTELETALRLWIKSIIMAEQATRGYKRKFISFDALLQNPNNALEECINLVKATEGPEGKEKSIKYTNSPRNHDSLSEAASFIDKGLKRQQALTTDDALTAINKSRIIKLSALAEKVYNAILANLADDLGMSRSLDKLRPCVTELAA